MTNYAMLKILAKKEKQSLEQDLLEAEKHKKNTEKGMEQLKEDVELLKKHTGKDIEQLKKVLKADD